MTRSLRLTAVAVAASTLVLFGCGSSGDDNADSTTTTAPATTTTDANAAFVAQLNELCRAGEDTASAATDDFQSALEDIQTATQAQDQQAYRTALDQAESAMEGVIGAVDDFASAVDQLDVPAEAEAALSSYLDALDEQKALAEDMRTAIVNDDGDAFTQAANAIEAANDANDAARRDAANELGATDCLPNEDSSTTTTATG